MTQTIASLVTVTAGLFFSVVVALLVEELVFGALFRVFFGRARRYRDSARANDLSRH